MVTLNDVFSMTQEQFNALSYEDKDRLAREFAEKVLFDTPLDKQQRVFTFIECSEMFGDEFDREFYAETDFNKQKALVEEWGARLKYLKSVLDMETIFDQVLGAHRQALEDWNGDD